MPTSFAPSFGGLWYSGSGSASDVPIRLPVAIGGHAYLVDLAEYDRQTVDAMRSAYDSLAEPGEQSLSTAGIWRRSQTHWEMGAGQSHFDEKDSDPMRFHSSKGVDPWTVRTLRLLPDTEQKRSSSNSNLKLLSIGSSYLYCVDGTEVYFSSNPTSSSPTWTAAAINIAEGAQTVSDITTDGNVVYAAVGSNGIHKTTVAATSSTHLSAYQASLVAFANGHLLAANANDISEISNSGTATSLYSHFNTSFSWVSIVGSPTGIFAAGNSGDRGEFYFIGFNSSTGGLAVPLPAGSLPRGEFIRTMTYYGGVLLLGTSKGFRIAEIVQDRGVAPGPAITAPGDVKCLAVDSDFVWFGWSGFDSSSSGLGRAWLARFTETLVPAYASDAMIPSGSTITADVLSAASFGGRRYFAVTGSGVYGEKSSLVPSGTLRAGLVRWGTMEKKAISTTSFKHDPLDGSVTISLINEAGDTYDAGTNSVVDSTEPAFEYDGGGVDGETVEVLLTLARSGTDATAGPVVRRWTVRAAVIPRLTDSIVVPIILKSKVKNLVGEGQTVSYDTLAEFQFLKGLEASRVPITYQEGEKSEQVIVDKVQVKPEKWVERTHRWFEGKVYVRLLTVQPSTTTES